MSISKLSRKKAGLLPSRNGVVSIEELENKLNIHQNNLIHFKNISSFIQIWGDNSYAVFSKSLLDELISIGDKDPKDISSYKEVFTGYVEALRAQPLISCEKIFEEYNLTLYLSFNKSIGEKFLNYPYSLKAEKQKENILKAFQKKGLYAYDRYLEEKDHLIEIKMEDVFLYQLHLDSRENSKLFEILDKYRLHDYDYQYIASQILPNKFRSTDLELSELMSVVDFNKVVLDKKFYQLKSETMFIEIEEGAPLTLKMILPVINFQSKICSKIIKNEDDDSFVVNGNKTHINEYLSEEITEAWQVKSLNKFLDKKIENNKSVKAVQKYGNMKTCLKNILLSLNLDKSTNSSSDIKSRNKI